MATRPSSTAIVRRICRYLKAHGSAEHAAGVQWFFKEEVRSHGWYTAELRRYGRGLHGELSRDPGLLFDVAEQLFGRTFIEEKILGVVMLQPSVRRFEQAEFDRLERWLDGVTSWADHDALAMYLLGPLMVREPRRVRRVFLWARARSRWHRRAAAVAPISGVRAGLFTAEATRLTRTLLADPDDMVQKGLGWLLREWSKVRAEETVPLLLQVRGQAPRLVLRTACETLAPAVRARILGR
ncbi:MAG: DNA alkylation repair protein [Acidobacteria bacterium]|nr:DNA alkylation repair protein [Acidobacteriota bacterium]